VFLLFGLLVVTGINGSSVGHYHRILYGQNVQDPDLIYGNPKSIRSDEFLIFSPNVASQVQAGYPAFNENIGSGRELVIIPEAPMVDWVGLFRPHTFAYFVMPFTQAFAFAWWVGLFTLIVSSYFFLLRILRVNNHKKLLAIILGISFAFSPFIMWWFQIALLLCLSYFFMAAILLMRLIQREPIRFVGSQRTSNIIYSAALAYIGGSMGLLLYAPFLIPVAIVLAFFLAGYILDSLKARKIKVTNIKKAFLPVFASLAVVAAIGVAFYFDRREMINTIANTIYPGDREVASGYLPFSAINRFFDSFLMPLLPAPPTGEFYANQSEASNFILLLPFLLIPGILLNIYDYIKNRNINWSLLLMNLLAVLFIVRITIPIGDGFYKLLLLDRVPNNRLMIGLGLVNFLQLIYLSMRLAEMKIRRRLLISVAAITSFTAFVLLLAFSKYFFYEYLVFEHNRLVVGSLAAFFAAIVAVFLLNKMLLGASLLLAFTLLSSFRVLPLQKGMTFYEDSPIINKIQEVSDPSESWAVVDNFPFESLPTIAGRKLINGRHPYPDFEFWRQLDKDGRFENVYNRQAHVLFITDTAKPSKFLRDSFAGIKDEMELVKGNVFKVKFECGDFVYRNVDFVLSTHSLNLECVLPVDTVEYPNATFYIYRIDKNK
jgi:hypothetical protein